MERLHLAYPGAHIVAAVDASNLALLPRLLMS
jgi:hypothetical protein